MDAAKPTIDRPSSPPHRPTEGEEEDQGTQSLLREIGRRTRRMLHRHCRPMWCNSYSICLQVVQRWKGAMVGREGCSAEGEGAEWGRAGKGLVAAWAFLSVIYYKDRLDGLH